MTLVLCESCGSVFERKPDESWKRLCFECWLQKKREEDDVNRRGRPGSSYRYRKARGHDHYRAPAPAHYKEPMVSDHDMRLRLPSMIRLCHPDKHGNSEAANEITKWLLELRKKLEP